MTESKSACSLIPRQKVVVRAVRFVAEGVYTFSEWLEKLANALTSLSNRF